MSVFKPNPRLEAELAVATRPVIRRAAQVAAAHAAPLTKRTRPDKNHRPIEVGEIDGDIAVVNTNYGGHIEEFGSKNNPAYAPLRRGVQGAGFELRES